MIDQINISNIHKVYFIGIGGIGMSAIARYFLSLGIGVYGYDKTSTRLTNALSQEGAVISFKDDPSSCPVDVDMVIYTPAIPSDSGIMQFYNQLQKPLLKRSDALGLISKNSYNICIAGTHGKTTISTMVAHVLRDAAYGCNAFLGGISSNYETNFWSSENNCTVIEADEYDRSFLKLHPNIIAITSMDPDHLDIYGTASAMEEAFLSFVNKLNADGLLITKKGLVKVDSFTAKNHLTYHLNQAEADVHVSEMNIVNGGYEYNVQGPGWTLKQVRLNMGGMHNVENSLVAIAIAKYLKIADDRILNAIAGFKGVKRRFEFIVKNEKAIYIDDYAHHPEELRALITGVRGLYPSKKITVVFQPHLYSRTRDFAEGFAESLSMADQVAIMPIYPAREKPIEGVTSEIISSKMTSKVSLLQDKDVLKFIDQSNPELLVTAGAGDIDQSVGPIKAFLLNQ
ncbi:MAG: UDP-N-acetylmuramate--L-alanine ligase [Chitinophagaceae bacterium]|jgi:UDP-N-acetylmuramate--alanine ligase